MASRADDELNPLLSWFSTLSDMARVRILRLLESEELSVGELARALQLPQSTVSRHLKVLLEDGWLSRRTAGTAGLYRLADAQMETEAAELWRLLQQRLDATAALHEDELRLQRVIAERSTDSKAFFGRLGGEWDEVRSELFGRGFTSQALLNLLPPDAVIADLGCGTGDASQHLAPHVGKVIAVDREPTMLDAARKRLAAYDNVDFRQGDLTDLPIENATVDAALIVLVLHHVPNPADAVRECARTLKPDGVLMIVDMVAHDRETYRQTMGHLHLGFDENALREWGEHAGMPNVRYRLLETDVNSKGPPLFAATLRRS